MAVDLIDMFTRQYPKESVLLMDWKMTRANLFKQTSNRKRYIHIYTLSRRTHSFFLCLENIWIYNLGCYIQH